MLGRLAAVSGLLLALLGCGGDSTSPRQTDHIVAGDVLSGTVSVGSPATYHLTVKAKEQIALYLEVPGSAVSISLINSSSFTVASAFGESDQPGSLRHAVLTPRSDTDAEFTVRLEAVHDGSTYKVRAVAIDRHPETGSAEIQLGTIIQGAIDHPMDVDEYTFNGVAGKEYAIYLQRLGPGTNGDVIGRINTEGDFFTAVAADADLESNAAKLSAGQTGQYTLVIQGYFAPELAYVGPYRFEVLPIDHAPEHAAKVLIPGDTINESIDHVGDVDEFTVSGAPGDEFNVFIEASGAAPHGVSATVDGKYETTVTANPGSPLLQNATGRFAIPASGSSTVRVSDLREYGGLYRGPYRLFLARLQRTPEGTPPTAVVGAPPITGRIELPGDVDEYTINITTPTIMNLMFERALDGTGGLVRAQLLKGAQGDDYVQFDAILNASTSGELLSSRHVSLAPGTYRVRVDGESSRGTGYRGGYELELRQVHAEPETIGSRIALGDTVRTESIEYAGDVDTYILPVTAADTFHLRLDTPGQPNPGITFYVIDPRTGVTFTGATGDETYPPTHTYVESPRLTLEPGEYRILVQAANEGARVTEKGPYHFVAERVSARPEHRAPALALGDTVSNEPIDYLGDYDDFIVHGSYGQEIFVRFDSPSNPQAMGVSSPAAIAIVDSATGAVLQGTQSYGFVQDTRRVAFPVSGVLRIRVQAIGNHTGGYWFVAWPVNRAPELRSASFAVGDTVSDAILPSGDVDEFVMQGSAGQSVDLYFQAPNGLTTGFGALQLDLIDLTTGAVVATLTTNNFSANLEDVARRGVVLPSTGSYQVRVQSIGDLPPEANYRFRIAPTP